MASLETRKKAIGLGKQLVALLGYGNDKDMLLHWMAHYVGEQIAVAETSTGREKRIAEERACDTILKIWEKRNHLPDGFRPFESFEPIFRALALLDLESHRPYYLRSIRQGKPASNKRERETDHFIEFVLSADEAARSLIDMGMRYAIDKATTPKLKKLLKAAELIDFASDTAIVRRLVELDAIQTSKQDAIREQKIKWLESRIASLERFCRVCAEIIPKLTKELDEIRKPSKKSEKTPNKHGMSNRRKLDSADASIPREAMKSK